MFLTSTLAAKHIAVFAIIGAVIGLPPAVTYKYDVHSEF
jgi:hypothetical protein